jgi:hypothetical protein
MKRREFLSAAAAVVTMPALGQVPNAPVLSIGGGPFNYYISPTGDDNNPGTLASPWSITALNSKQSTYGGKRVGLLPGTYQYGTVGGVQTTLNSMVSSSGCALQVQGGSTAASTYIGSSDSTGNYSARTAILDGSNPSTGAQPTGSGIFLGQSNASPAGYVTIDGLVIRNFNYAAIGFTNAPYVFPGVIIQNCELYNGGGVPSSNNPGAIFFWKEMPGGLITNCKIYNLRTNGGTYSPYGYAGIMFNQDAGSGEGFTATIDHCTIYNTGQCVETKNNVANVAVQYCYLEYGDPLGNFTGSAFPYGVFGINTPAATSVTYKYNIIIGGYFLYTTDGGANSGAVIIHNSTLYCGPANGTSAANGMIEAINNKGTVAWDHCLFWSDGGWDHSGPGSVGGSAGGGFTADYNTYGSACNFSPGGTFSGWQSAGHDAHGASIATTPFATTPVSAQNWTSPIPLSFVPSTAYLTASDGKPCGALNSSGQAADGSGGVGCNF